MLEREFKPAKGGDQAFAFVSDLGTSDLQVSEPIRSQ